MADDLNMLVENLKEVFADKIVSLEGKLGELTLGVAAGDMRAVFSRLRDDAKFRFDQLIDLCGVDYSTYGSDASEGGVYLNVDAEANAFKHRFAAVYHLLSVERNIRLRV